MSWSICIFAHNEAERLPQCLAALDGAAAGGDYTAHVMENGSTDRTAEAARAFSCLDSRVQVHELPVGDKANAWNEYVHRIAGDADMHIFIDGDVRPTKGSFRAFETAFGRSPHAYGAAALPATGRSRKHWTHRLFDEHYLSGNLYALSGEAVSKIRKQKFRFPFGAVGEDGLLTYLLLTDLKGYDDDSHTDRIAIASGAFFEFDSLGLSPGDVNIYLNRLKRYSRRYIQNHIMYPVLKREGISVLPEHIDTIFTPSALNSVTPRNDPVNFAVDRLMLRALKKNPLWLCNHAVKHNAASCKSSHIRRACASWSGPFSLTTVLDPEAVGQQSC